MSISLRWITCAGALAAGTLLANFADAQTRTKRPGGQAPNQPGVQVQEPRAAGQQGQPGQAATGQAATGQAATGQAATGQAQSRTTLRPVQPSQDNLSRTSDQQIAEMLLIDAEAEVAMGEFAEQHAKHEQVKKLADMMMHDHSKSIAALRQIVGKAPAENGKTGASAVEATKNANRLAGGTATVDNRLNFVAIKKQIAAECQAWDKKELGKKKGTDFDIAFTGQQIDRHMQIICAERVLRQFASPELKGMIEQDLKSAEHHYEMALQIMQQLNSQRGSLQSQAPSAGERGTAAAKQRETNSAVQGSR